MSRRIAFQAATDFETVHPGHHDIEEYDIAAALGADGESLGPTHDRHDFEIFSGQTRFQQFEIRSEIIDDQNAR